MNFLQIACFKDQEVALREQHGLVVKELESEIYTLKTKEKPPVLIPCDHEEEINQLQVNIQLKWNIVIDNIHLGVITWQHLNEWKVNIIKPFIF